MKKNDMISTTEFARLTDTPYPTVVRWAQGGIIPGAEREETLRGPVWLIPRSAIESFEQWRPSIGRPQKSQEEKAKKKPKR